MLTDTGSHSFGYCGEDKPAPPVEVKTTPRAKSAVSEENAEQPKGIWDLPILRLGLAGRREGR